MRHVVIDTDPGVDDAHAILMALSHPDVVVEAITTVAGNVALSKTTANVLKILEVAGNTSIPVYPGCVRPLLEQVPDASLVHGIDGLGDCGIPDASCVPYPEHAVQALIRLGNAMPGLLTLVALGPLTNVAMATQLDPTLPQKYAGLVIMGGAIHSMGNAPNVTAEFNIHQDPEAAAIVFKHWKGLTLVSWETTMDYGVPVEWYRSLDRFGTRRSEFLAKISENIIRFFSDTLKREALFAADPLAMAVALDPQMVRKSGFHHVRVELSGQTRGQTSVDWFGLSRLEPNVHVVLEINPQRFMELLECGVA